MPIPAIGQIADPSKVRVALVQDQQIISAPLLSVLGPAVDAILGDGLLLSGDEQDMGFDRLSLEGDESGDLLLS